MRAPFLLFFGARTFSEFSQQMVSVAMGWQLYALTHSAFALGMVGLAQFVPTALLTFAAGHVADRYERKRVVQLCQFTEGLVAVFLAWSSFAGRLHPIEIFLAIIVFGTAEAFESPAMAALLPGVVEEGFLQRGTALSTGAMQLAMICGPALGGLIYAIAPGAPYAVVAGFWLAAGMLNGAIQMTRPAIAKESPTLKSLFAGAAFVRGTPEILGTISLDLFAVLLGGATALLPIFAHDILHTGPWGLGVLRSAPAVGALLMTAFLSRHALKGKVGIRMFQAVIVFGLATVTFALSRSFYISIIALAILGAADTVSVVIRTSLVQLRTPDDLRGRVSAVNFLFINASNQLGAFESGVMAALLGAVPATIVGGAGTVLVALLWMKLFPTLRGVKNLESNE